MTQRVLRVYCRALAPGVARASAASELCNRVLGDIPGPVHCVGLRARRPEIQDGRVWLQCPRPDCLTWNVFELSDASPDPAALSEAAAVAAQKF